MITDYIGAYDMHRFVADAVGFIATGLFIYSSSLTDDKKLSFFYTIGCFLLAAHLFLMGSMYAGAVTTLSGIRNMVAPFDKTGLVKKLFMMIFIGLLAYTLVESSDLVDIIPALSSAIMSYAFLYTKNNALSFCIFVSASLWFVVAISIGSVPMMVLEAATIATLTYRVFKSNFAGATA